jgi:hypothetical protein
VLTIGRIGFWAGLAAFTATVLYDLVQVLQVAGVLHFPLDEILIFGTSLCIVVPFVLEMLAFHYSSAGEERFWSHAALIFASIYAVFGMANYVVQLATVIPARLHGAADTVRFLEQTPHSLLWDFDAIAYLAMGLATLVMVPALRNVHVERRLRIACIANTRGDDARRYRLFLSNVFEYAFAHRLPVGNHCAAIYVTLSDRVANEVHRAAGFGLRSTFRRATSSFA